MLYRSWMFSQAIVSVFQLHKTLFIFNYTSANPKSIMKITYYGHSCFGFSINGKHILFDPFISPNELAQSINVSDIPVDYLLLSHGHQDHVADAESILLQTGAKLISNYEIVSWYGAKGVTNAHPVNLGGSIDTEFGRVKYVNAIHSSVLPDGTYGGNPGGFVVESEEGSFYYSGDTALTYDMKLIGEFHKLDLAILCIGDNFTMGVNDAIIASDFVGCNKVIGMHYDTFGYIKIDHEEAKKAFQAKGKELILMNIGDQMTI